MSLKKLKNSKDFTFRFTQNPSDYLNNVSANSLEAKSLKESLLPTAEGVTTVHGELLLAVTHIYDASQTDSGSEMVEFEDNGYDCDHCDYYDQDDPAEEHDEVCDGCYELTDTYKGHFNVLKRWMPQHDKDIDLAIETLTDAPRAKMPNIIFDRLIDHVIHTILTTENQAAVWELAL